MTDETVESKASDPAQSAGAARQQTSLASDPRIMLRAAVQGAYDLQHLRIASGLRLCANFRSKLKLSMPPKPDTEEEDADTEKDEKEDKEALKLLDQLRSEYRRLTDGVASTRGRAKKAVFTGIDLISTEAEKVLCSMYFGLEKEESHQFKQLVVLLEAVPIYTAWLSEQNGVGPAMAGVLIAYLDPHKARHVSSFWKYCGLDIGPDGMGRSRRQSHLVEREYKDRNGDPKTRLSVTYEPFLKTKCMGVLAACFLRGNCQPWRQIYDDYKHRLVSDPSRIKVNTAQWKKAYKAGEDVKTLWTPGRINNASKRYMVKMFLLELWRRWRELEGLEVTPPYSVDKQGQRPHRAA